MRNSIPNETLNLITPTNLDVGIVHEKLNTKGNLEKLPVIVETIKH